jgi:hypothetical protein
MQSLENWERGSRRSVKAMPTNLSLNKK